MHNDFGNSLCIVVIIIHIRMHGTTTKAKLCKVTQQAFFLSDFSRNQKKNFKLQDIQVAVVLISLFTFLHFTFHEHKNTIHHFCFYSNMS